MGILEMHTIFFSKPLKSKYKASTLIESVVGMTLLLIFLFLAMVIFANMNKNNNANLKVRAHIISDYYLKYTLNEKRFFDEAFNDAGMRVEKKVETINNHALLINVEVYNADTNLILEKKSIVKVE